MSEPAAKAYIVDDDLSFRRSLSRLLTAHGIANAVFDSARALMECDLSGCTGCVLLDVHMPDLDGLRLQEHLGRAACALPVIFITGRGDIPTSVRAMKAGAADFLTKPVDEKVLIATIERAFVESRRIHGERAYADAVRERVRSLTEREREVMRHVIAGALNKQIGSDLAIAEKTVKVHRGRVMEKMGTASVADLVRLCTLAGIAPAGTTKVQ